MSKKRNLKCFILGHKMKEKSRSFEEYNSQSTIIYKCKICGNKEEQIRI